nr:DeoR family transcriptional regulator [Quadrisphaera sp. INWT6]
MLAAERRDDLLARLARDGKVVAKDVAAEAGALGGQRPPGPARARRRRAVPARLRRALPVSPAVGDYAARGSVAVDSKARVAARAVQLVRPGSTVLLDGGTTALARRPRPPPRPALHGGDAQPDGGRSPRRAPRGRRVRAGRALFKHSAVTCGAAAVEAAQAVSADLFLLGVTGIHPEQGLTTGDPEEAAMKRALAARAADTYVLASREKVGAASPFQVLPLDAVAGVITDAPPSEVLDGLAERGVAVLTAP